jgi:TatD DNase family protein
VATLVTIGTDLETSEQAIHAARAFEGVHAVVGIHPNDAQQATDEALARLAELATDETVVGIGETGLDFYRDWCPHEVQERSFRAHIDLAHEQDLTLVIHCRDAWDRTLEVLHDHGAPERVVMHCFSGDRHVAEHCNQQGWFMSFAGNVTFKNAQDLRDAAAAASLDLLLTETDSPYLTPEPHRGTRNDSSMIPLVTAQLAGVHGLDVEDLAPRLVANAHRAFALPAAAHRERTAATDGATPVPDQGTAA